ncbi:cellulose biosynthesis protein BcsO [Enterobacter sp. BIGb0383]|uniref:cellulose biosynthesis protein BcsO n=1 Tax=unclassified Enterobacter TaxID=2608935 RepID=UPI000F482F14|nr:MULTISPECIES: cellulose biosynthesis protein BcsO [unclassified Enterobacter]ROP56303.1 cellulose biosynthesis protein BcsO [Enterobacter sp. BIGb0383]ROS06042.1 cellulose biosynthesis protein BcsO [Enterobacter sp. BIGb0359]
MHHYDDLQRFKDKTRTSTLTFRDLSSQNRNREQGNWSIVNQMATGPGTVSLAKGGNVTQPIPQAVDPQTFVLNDVPAPAPATVPASSPSIVKTLAVQAAPAVAPATGPLPEPVVVPAPPTNFSRLFAAPPAETSRTVEKNQPLQSLLERIATCR